MLDIKSMKASELVKALQDAIAERGDLLVYLRDPDTDWPGGIEFDKEAVKLKRDYPDLPPCFSITSESMYDR